MNVDDVIASNLDGFSCLDESQVLELDVAQLPCIIARQFEKLTEVSKRVETATERAEKAKKTTSSAKGKKIGFFGGGKTAAIESLQDAVVDLSTAQLEGTDALKTSMECQEALSEVTKYLFTLGVGNLTLNRTVVRELEVKLSGASRETLSDLAKMEVMNVVKQLKAQEDIMVKQEKHAEVLRARIEKDKEHDRLLQEQSEKDKEHDRMLAGHEAKLLYFEDQIALLRALVQKQSYEIEALSKPRRASKWLWIAIVVLIPSSVVALLLSIAATFLR